MQRKIFQNSNSLIGTMRAGRFFKTLDNNFMEQVLREPTLKDYLLDLLFLNRVDFMSKVVVGGHLGYSDCEIIEFKILVDRRRSPSKASTLDMWRADFRVLRELVSDVPWENVFAAVGVPQCWSIFKLHVLRA